MKSKSKENSRKVLKQILSGRITKEQAAERLEREKPFDLHAALFEFCEGDPDIMRSFFPDRYPIQP
ncbi:hypothetical protein [Pontibacter sp. SGAir0037]|uniref:hypothetical protein n=1 Tax=Pontibacter sp. SGAir0037 TaxID=2571030 RepID=UPI0010CCF78B|nr:hypothetical protein [Pontibacter sp. SGAir0037]QCR24752.1 hypothetical protein C1N53_21940 [Pontibacter sp. SGAir0037]